MAAKAEMLRAVPYLFQIGRRQEMDFKCLGPSVGLDLSFVRKINVVL